jgi:Protein of unknown function (DUF4235)
VAAHCISSGVEMADSAANGVIVARAGSTTDGRWLLGPTSAVALREFAGKACLSRGCDASRLSDRGKRLLVPLIKKYGWKAITIALGALVGLATQRLIEMPWKRLRGSSPPKVLADRRSPWGDAVSWAIASGVGVGVARLVAIRAAAGVWEAAVHEPPPEPGLAVSTAA